MSARFEPRQIDMAVEAVYNDICESPIYEDGTPEDALAYLEGLRTQIDTAIAGLRTDIARSGR